MDRDDFQKWKKNLEIESFRNWKLLMSIEERMNNIEITINDLVKRLSFLEGKEHESDK
jgi:hypothetical protein